MEFERWTDEQLLESPPGGAAGRTFEAFYCRHERLIAAYHLRRAPDPEIAADLTAETFARALEARAKFRGQGHGSAVRWLYGIASNVRALSARQAVAELTKARELGLTRRGLDSEQHAELALLATEGGVLSALEALPAEQRDAIRARILDDLPYADQASLAGLPESTIRKRVSRGIATLRKTAKESA
ncbi:MAG: sigma-70 family RNA polymerase sigma factor [Solirubrobacteraceae bacterium]|nr:sigma-70 family RNA polymerase sigma factor [Solirubrobacteraceae bacterium]